MYSEEINRAVADGSRAYSAQNYELASEKYGEACQLFNEKEGSDDFDLLFLYGKALFQNAVLRSEVFGGKADLVSGEEEKEPEKKEEETGNFQFSEDAPLAEEDDAEGPVLAEEDEDDEENEENKNEENENEENEENEQSDFEVAWEILDLTRSLIEGKIKETEDKEPAKPYLKSDKDETSNKFVLLTKKLSEVYDLLGEVSLEAENFQQSATDLERCLDLRLALYPATSSLVSESHYKLSLALEFCVEDPELRSKATEQMRLAIESVKERTASEEDPEKKKDNKELLKDLQVRFNELEKDPAKEIELQQIDMIKGLLGEAVGSSSANDLTAAVKKVNDLSGAVKKKAVNDLSGAVKRKAPQKDAQKKAKK